MHLQTKIAATVVRADKIVKSFRNKQIANAIHLAWTSFLMELKPGTLTVATSNSTTELRP